MKNGRAEKRKLIQAPRNGSPSRITLGNSEITSAILQSKGRLAQYSITVKKFPRNLQTISPNVITSMLGVDAGVA